MDGLLKEIKKLRNSSTGERINKRLREFESFKNKKSEDWFSELCFCILTANSKGRTAFNIQKELGYKGFASRKFVEIRDVILRNKHRFHNNKARFIVEARKHLDIKEKINKKIKEKGEFEAREWLVNNVKGFGYKEASHFLRNTGCKNLAILDRHVLNLMLESRIIKEKPKTIAGKKYLELEKKLEAAANAAGMSQAELDMYLWHMRTNDVLK